MAGGQCPPEYPLYTASSRLKRLDTGSLHTHLHCCSPPISRFLPPASPCSCLSLKGGYAAVNASASLRTLPASSALTTAQVQRANMRRFRRKLS
ncbi:hypothetical protein AOLI_G00278550 [Acnodon oligacanthus]